MQSKRRHFICDALERRINIVTLRQRSFSGVSKAFPATSFKFLRVLDLWVVYLGVDINGGCAQPYTFLLGDDSIANEEARVIL